MSLLHRRELAPSSSRRPIRRIRPCNSANRRVQQEWTDRSSFSPSRILRRLRHSSEIYPGNTPYCYRTAQPLLRCSSTTCMNLDKGY